MDIVRSSSNTQSSSKILQVVTLRNRKSKSFPILASKLTRAVNVFVSFFSEMAQNPECAQTCQHTEAQSGRNLCVPRVPLPRRAGSQ